MLDRIPWSTDRVLRETIARLHGAVADVEMLDPRLEQSSRIEPWRRRDEEASDRDLHGRLCLLR